MGTAPNHRCRDFFFLLVHVLDTALVRLSPEAYNAVINTYKTPLIGVAELGLVAAILYHALNGLRIILIDFWRKGVKYQNVMFWSWLLSPSRYSLPLPLAT